MTTDEAKVYCIDVIGMSEDDFRLAEKEDIELDIAKEGEWCHYYIWTPYEGLPEGDMDTAIEIAKEHKFWGDPKNVDSYVDYYMESE